MKKIKDYFKQELQEQVLQQENILRFWIVMTMFLSTIIEL